MTTAAPETGRELPDIQTGELLQWLADMTLIRAFEQTADSLALRGKIPGGMHPAIGQEAVAVGAARALHSSDIMTGTHRSHHHALARQLPPAGVLAELYGKATGINGGRGGSMHLADFDRGLWGSNGIVGAGLGVALGAALGANVRSTGQVVLGFFGDGGANTGRVWEFVNLAAIWSLPLIIACENNLYAVETTSRQMTGGGDVAARAQGFGLPSAGVDGQDVVAVYRAVSTAAERARSGGGPTFLEFRTYRFLGHNSGEVIRYRTTEEVEEWRSSRDPIKNFIALLTDAGVLDSDLLASIDETTSAAIADAVTFAEEAPWPDPSTAAENVSSLSNDWGHRR
jgi:TPP-dependent pyruvate/acetoin dehydrogenase alpha subunit